VTIRVFQGEREMAADNKLLGQFDLVGIPPAPRGVPQIEVTFDIDANGIVNVTARDKATGKEQQIRIQATGGLSEADIQRMVQEAEQHAAEDRGRRELVEARNQADAIIYTAEKQLEEHGARVSDAERRPVEEAITALREAVSGENTAGIRQRLEALSQALTRLGEAIHRAAAARPEEPAAAGGQAATGGEDVVDAEFEDVDKRRHG
jgi:molecular chaperone DnaK